MGLIPDVQGFSVKSLHKMMDSSHYKQKKEKSHDHINTYRKILTNSNRQQIHDKTLSELEIESPKLKNVCAKQKTTTSIL